jgi:hypothetical protein
LAGGETNRWYGLGFGLGGDAELDDVTGGTLRHRERSEATQRGVMLPLVASLRSQ